MGLVFSTSKKVGIRQWNDYSKRDGFQVESLKKERNIFVAGKNSDVYHPIGCYVVNNDIKPENLIYYYSEQEATKDNRHRSQVKGCWETYQSWGR